MTTFSPAAAGRRRVAVALAVASLLAALLTTGLVDAGASAAPSRPAAAPVLTLISQWAPRLPQSTYDVITVQVESTETADVTLTATPGAGLTASPQSWSATVPAGPGTITDVSSQPPADPDDQDPLSYGQFRVASDVPGFHTLRITASADGAQPVSVVLPRIWQGGAEQTLPRRNSFAGHLYAYQGVGSDTTPDGTTYSSTTTSFLNFYDSSRVTFQPAVRGRIVCPDYAHQDELDTCTPYQHDGVTGLTQVGDASIGLFDPKTAYFDAGPRLRYQRLVYPHARQRLAGTWDFTDRTEESGTVTAEHLTLTRRGRYTLRYTADGRHTRSAGTYRIRRKGELVLHHGHGRHRRTSIETLVLGSTLGGRPAPGRYGVYLDVRLPAPRTGYEGNVLKPVRHRG